MLGGFTCIVRRERHKRSVVLGGDPARTGRPPVVRRWRRKSGRVVTSGYGKGDAMKNHAAKDTGTHFVAVRQNLQAAMARVRKVRQERDARTQAESRKPLPQH